MQRITKSPGNLVRLAPYEEAIGELLEIENDGHATVARLGRITLLLPIEMAEVLRPSIGLKIGILRTDIPGKEYLVRVCDQPKTCEASAPQEVACA